MKKIILILFLLLVFVELGLQTFWLGELNVYSRPAIYLLLSFIYLFIGFYFSILDKDEKLINFNFKFNINFIFILTIIGLGFLIYPTILDYLDVLSKNKIDPKASDVIPSVELYVRRFLSGDRVYAPLPMPGYEISPDYVSLLWMPYIIPELLHFDYRIFPLVLFFIFVFSYFGYLFVKQKNNITIYFFPIFSFFFLYQIVKYDSIIFARTLELTIVVFYMILSVTIMHKNRFVLVIGILLCLLSRYSLSFWLVSYVLVILIDRGFKEFFIINLYILIGVLTMFIPFIIHDLNIFVEGLKYYNKATLGEWKPHDWQNAGEKPYTLSKGHGIAIYFYDFIQGGVEVRLKSLRITHLILSVLSGLSLFVIFINKKNKIKDTKLFLMFGLKFFLMIFFVFIQIPYNYLFIVPLFLSIPIFGELINKKKILFVSS